MAIITRLGMALCAALALATVMGASPARADWLKAETPNFIIYSDGGERPLREYAMKLEVFDRFLRMRFGVPLDRPVARKLPIYLVRRQGDLAQVQPGIGESIAGFYYPAEEDIFAVAVRGDGESTLLHEYAHHFFFQHFSAYYPGWLVEGLAEYVSTARIWPDRIQVGAHDEARASWLTNVQWLPMDVLLSKRFGEIERGIHQATYYPVSWLLTHWFMSSPERVVKLEAYLGLIRQGVDPTTAMQQATGLTLDQLRNTLRDHLYGRIELNTYDIDLPNLEVGISRMPPSANDLLLLGQRLKVPMSKENREIALEEARRMAARHPDDPLALLVLGHAELHIGDRAAGEAAFTRLLEMEPDNIDALQFMAMARIEDAADLPDERPELMNLARGYLLKAYQADPGNYLTLMLIARSRDGAPGYPNDNDLATWEMAFIAAPQLSNIRLGAGHAFLAAGDKGTAIALLEPLANAPHGGDGAEAAQKLIDEANGIIREDSDEAESEAEAEVAED
jgi:hypothetical protein